MSAPRYQIGLVLSASEVRRVWEDATRLAFPHVEEKAIRLPFGLHESGGRYNAAILIVKPTGKAMLAVALGVPVSIGERLLADFADELLEGEAMRAKFADAGRLGGKAGGKSRSEAKLAAVRANGRKGGRPRKNPAPVDKEKGGG